MVRRRRLPAGEELSPSHALLHERGDPRFCRIALLGAILFHGVLITLTFPTFRRVPIEAPRPEPPLRLAPLPVPPLPTPTALPAVLLRDRTARLVPVPDPEPGPIELVPEVRPALDAPRLDPRVGIVLRTPVPPPNPGPLRPGVDPGVTYPVLIDGSRVVPRYPDPARTAGGQGRVILEAVVHRDGSVGELQVLQCTNPGLGFEEEAMQAVRQWRYRPGRQHGRPAEVTFTVIVEFVLEH